MAGYRQRLADRINAELNAKAMSVDDLAYKSGVSDKTIKRLLLAKHDARPSTRRRLAEGLDLDPGELSPEAEADQLRRLEEKLDEVLAFLRADEKAERVSALAGEAAAEAKPPARRTRRKPRLPKGWTVGPIPGSQYDLAYRLRLRNLQQVRVGHLAGGGARGLHRCLKRY